MEEEYCCICGDKIRDENFSRLIDKHLNETVFCETCADKLNNIIKHAPDGISCAHSELEGE